MVETHGLTHIALAVADAERSLRFYQQVFGIVAVYREDGFIQAQTPGSRDVLVFEEGAGKPGKSGGIAHFGFRLLDPEDIEAASAAVAGAGGEILSQGEFVPGEPYLFFRDPDGYEVEIWYELPTPVDPPPADVRQFLRHVVATLAYRAEKVLRDAPEDFAELRLGPTSRTPGEILAHLGDLLDWAQAHLEGRQAWHDSKPLPWREEVECFFAALQRVEGHLASAEPIACPPERLFQGPLADALTHVGQIALLRRLAGAPVKGENYFKAEIVAGRVGPRQSERRVEFD